MVGGLAYFCVALSSILEHPLAVRTPPTNEHSMNQSEYKVTSPLWWVTTKDSVKLEYEGKKLIMSREMVKIRIRACVYAFVSIMGCRTY